MPKIVQHKKEVSLKGVICAGILSAIGIVMFQNRAYITLLTIESRWWFLHRYYVGLSVGLIFGAFVLLYKSIKWGLPEALRLSVDSSTSSLAKQRSQMQDRKYKVTLKSIVVLVVLVLLFILLFSSIEILSQGTMADFIYNADTFFKGIELDRSVRY